MSADSRKVNNKENMVKITKKHLPADSVTVAKDKQDESSKTQVIDPENIRLSINKAVKQLDQAQKLKEVIDLVNDQTEKNYQTENKADEDTGWVLKTSKKRRQEMVKNNRAKVDVARPKPIIGTNEMANFKAAVRRAHFHVYKVEISATAEMINDHLTLNNFEDVECEKMASKYPLSYSSFKVSINYAQKDDITNPKLWPVNVLVDPFLTRLHYNVKRKKQDLEHPQLKNQQT